MKARNICNYLSCGSTSARYGGGDKPLIFLPRNYDGYPVVISFVMAYTINRHYVDGLLMNLQIRDPRAHELARRLAQRRRVSMTEAVIEALEAELQRALVRTSLADRLGAIADDLVALAKPGGRDMKQSEVDEMWGHL